MEAHILNSDYDIAAVAGTVCLRCTWQCMWLYSVIILRELHPVKAWFNVYIVGLFMIHIAVAESCTETTYHK